MNRHLKALCCLTTLLLLLSISVGCGKRRATGFVDGSSGSGSATADNSAVAQADALWDSSRGSAEGMREIIAAYEAALEASPDDYHTLIRLARAYYFLGDGYTTDETEKGELFNQATFYGERAMGTHACCDE